MCGRRHAEGICQTVKAVRPDDEVVLSICLGLAEGKAAKFFYVAKRNKKIFFLEYILIRYIMFEYVLILREYINICC